MADVRGMRAAAGRGVVAGLLGTTAMTITLNLERQYRRRFPGPVDYDATGHVVTAAAAVLHYRPHTAAGRRALYRIVHWGYGSAVGVGYPALRHVTHRDESATAMFYLGCQAMAMTMFPTLGGTPPPWRWRKDILISSLAQHAVYAAVVAAVDRHSRPR